MRTYPRFRTWLYSSILVIAICVTAVATTRDSRVDSALHRLERGAEQLAACRAAGGRLSECPSGERSLSHSRGTLTSDVFGVGTFAVTVGRGDRRTYSCSADSDRCDSGRWTPSD